MKLRAAVLLLAIASGPIAGHAVEPDEVLRDPALEERARAISAELRCLVCQNQSIDDSQAPLARDLRTVVRDRLKAGDSDVAVRDYLVARYGDFVLLKPPLKPETVLLWVGPFGLLAVGTMLVVLGKRANTEAGTEPLDPDEQARIDALMEEPGQ